MKQEQHQLKASKKHIQKKLRKAERKWKRLRERAHQLTDRGLVSVMLMRNEKKKDMTAAAVAGAPETKHAAADALVHEPGA